MTLVPTSSQTVGPFYQIGLAHLASDRVVAASAADVAVTVRGRVIDGDGVPVPDYLLEIWQRTLGGGTAFARVFPDDAGSFSFTTVKARSEAPHLVVLLFMRGLLKPLVTRMYFPGEPANDHDDVLALVPADRRSTMVARATDETTPSLEWNVTLQGTNETVFFEW